MSGSPKGKKKSPKSLSLTPKLKFASADKDTSSISGSSIDFEEELASWGGLLYKPSFASALSLNACYDPGVARTLDQCGTI